MSHYDIIKSFNFGWQYATNMWTHRVSDIGGLFLLSGLVVGTALTEFRVQAQPPSESTLNPNRIATRGFCAREIYQQFGKRLGSEPDYGRAMPFADIARTDAEWKPVFYLVKNGILTGNPSNVFLPKRALTRFELANILERMASRLKALNDSPNTSMQLWSKQQCSVCQDTFKDLDTHHWAYQAVAEVQQLGIMNGYPDGFFRGKRYVTVRELADCLKRMAEKYLPQSNSLL